MILTMKSKKFVKIEFLVIQSDSYEFGTDSTPPDPMYLLVFSMVWEDFVRHGLKIHAYSAFLWNSVKNHEIIKNHEILDFLKSL